MNALGMEAIGLQNDCGVLIDVKQLSSAAMADVPAKTRSPIDASHSADCAIVYARPNLRDQELLDIRDNGGVVQVVEFFSFLLAASPEKRDRLRDAWRRYGLEEPAHPADSLFVQSPEYHRQAQETSVGLLMHEFHANADHDSQDRTLSDLVSTSDPAVHVVGVDGGSSNHVAPGFGRIARARHQRVRTIVRTRPI